MMKDIMSKLANLEATAPKPKKMLTEDSTSPMITEPKARSLKDVFNEISETVAPGQKPLPVLDPNNKQAGMGFVTSNNPAVQNMLKNLDPKDVQIVQAPGKQPVGQQQQQQGQPAPAGATGQQPAGQMQMKEKWAGDVKLNPAKKGMFKGKTKAELEKQLAALHKSGPHKKGSPEYTKQQELNFAIRAKSGWKEDMEEGAGAKDWHDDMEQWALNKGLKNTGKKNSFQRAADRDNDWALSHRKSDTVKEESDAEKNAKETKKTFPNVKHLTKDGHPDWKKHGVKEGAKVDRMVKHIEKSERKLGKSKDEAEDIAWATANKRGMLDNKNKKKVKEGDIPSTRGDDTMGAGLGAGRSDEVLEGKKPDFRDLDGDGNKKESMKKAAADKKKKKVDESMNHRISAARLEGKSHGLRGHAHSGKRYEDIEEMKAYHEGYKEGLDECYGMGVYETAPAATVPGMASSAMPTMEDDMEEGNAFTAALARTPKGGKFSVGGKSFTDTSSLEEYAFESLDRQLNALLNEGEELSEGLSVSVSKGQQNSPDSVTITAQDAEADQLLQLVKHAGLGLFGDDHAEPSSAMSVQPDHGAPDEVGAGGVDVEVVDGHDGIMGLMQKLSGIQAAGAGDEDYADEEGGEEEHTCNECGMMEAECHCNEEQVEEVQTPDQLEAEVAEDNAPDSGAEDSVADEDAEAKEDAALAGEKEEEMNESFLNLLGRLNKLAESKEEESEELEENQQVGRHWFAILDPSLVDKIAELPGAEVDPDAGSVETTDPKLAQQLANYAAKNPTKLQSKQSSYINKSRAEFQGGSSVPDDLVGKHLGEGTEELDEGKWNYPKHMTKTVTTSDMDTTNAARNREERKAFRKKEKAKAHAALMKGEPKKEKDEELNEWANQAGKGPGKGTDASFEQDIDFMTKVIAGGLNKPKSTGQTTVPVIAGQDERMHDNPKDWATLAGIKK